MDLFGKWLEKRSNSGEAAKHKQEEELERIKKAEEIKEKENLYLFWYFAEDEIEAIIHTISAEGEDI